MSTDSARSFNTKSSGSDLDGVRASAVSPTVSEDGFEYREVTAALSDDDNENDGSGGGSGGGSSGDMDDDDVDEDLNTSMRLMNKSIMNSSFRTADGSRGSRGPALGLGDTFRSVGFSTVGSDTFGLGRPGSTADPHDHHGRLGSARAASATLASSSSSVLTAKLSAQQDAIDRLQTELSAEKRSTQEVAGRLDKSEKAVEAVQAALVETQVQLLQTREALRAVQSGSTSSWVGTELDLNETMGSSTTTSLLGEQLATKAQVSQILERLEALDGGGGASSVPTTEEAEATAAARAAGAMAGPEGADGGPDVWPKVI
jgi:hypothetical protein